jgi:hypothetical protein
LIVLSKHAKSLRYARRPDYASTQRILTCAFQDDPNEMVKIAHQLVEQPDVEAAVRVGDVFALLIEFYHSQGNMQQAYVLIEKMRERKIILNPCAMAPTRLARCLRHTATRLTSAFVDTSTRSSSNRCTLQWGSLIWTQLVHCPGRAAEKLMKTSRRICNPSVTTSCRGAG